MSKLSPSQLSALPSCLCSMANWLSEWPQDLLQVHAWELRPNVDFMKPERVWGESAGDAGGIFFFWWDNYRFGQWSDEFRCWYQLVRRVCFTLRDRPNKSWNKLELSLKGRNSTKDSLTLRVLFVFCNIKINLLETWWSVLFLGLHRMCKYVSVFWVSVLVLGLEVKVPELRLLG